MLESGEKKWSMSFNPLHLKYWIFILILVIVGLFSYYYSGDTNLAGMIAFAASIASIILSILAIFITLLSNNSIGGMLHKVRDLYDAVTPMPNTLDKSVSELKETTTNLSSVNLDIKKSLSDLEDHLQGLDEHLAKSDKKIDEIHRLTSANSKDGESPEQPSASLVEQYLNTMSFNGILILYSFLLYKEKHKKSVFSLDAFTKYLSGADPSYMLGILVASASANIIGYSNVNENNNMEIINLDISSYIKKETLSHRIEVICGNIRSRLDKDDPYYDPNVVEKKVSDYIDTLD